MSLQKHQNELIDIFNKTVTPHGIHEPDNVMYIDYEDKDIINFIENDPTYRGTNIKDFCHHRNKSFDKYHADILAAFTPYKPKMIACHIFKTSVTIHNDAHFCQQTKCSKAVILPVSIKKNTNYDDAPLHPILIHNKYSTLNEFSRVQFNPKNEHGLLSDHILLTLVAWE